MNKNPFEFEKANSLTVDEIIDYYIEDHNFSRFIQSSRNVFLEGERGSGKTMTLLYNSFPVQCRKAIRDGRPIDYSKIGIHIPCNTPLFHKREHLLLEDDFHKAMVAEHFLVLSIANSICRSLLEASDQQLNSALLSQEDSLRERLEYILGAELRKGDFVRGMQLYVQAEASRSQKAMNIISIEEFVKNAFSFATLIIPVLETLASISLLSESHFLLMIDDAHDLNKLQLKALNSWIAFRDNAQFSFKVATTKSDRPFYITATGGSIIAGHDFISVDLEKPYHNKASDFGKMAKKIVERRLKSYGIENPDAEKFFPMNAEMAKSLDECKEISRVKAIEKYPNGPDKSITDHIFKYHRVEYFRNRAAKSNKPPYSGFETITAISTGIVRHLLEPCFWMFDAAVSNQEKTTKVTHISPPIQSATIDNLSNKLWKRVKDGIDQEVEGCSREQASQVENMLEQLFILFRERLLRHQSEPRAIAFTVSERNSPDWEKLKPILDICQKALLLYTRLSTAKDDGKQEFYYVVNRMLIPAFKLDPVGQHARVSLKASDLMNAALNNRPLPFVEREDSIQPTLFDEI
jgi:hypothetical protein